VFFLTEARRRAQAAAAAAAMSTNVSFAIIDLIFQRFDFIIQRFDGKKSKSKRKRNNSVLPQIIRENKGEWFGMMYLLGAIRRL
jgi:hypothetical protein